jgi:putative transcriptional regulator
MSWRLSEIMARHGIKGIQLAKKLGISDNTVSKLRTAQEMPYLSGQKLNQLCDALNDLIWESGQSSSIIAPSDLITYSYKRTR